MKRNQVHLPPRRHERKVVHRKVHLVHMSQMEEREAIQPIANRRALVEKRKLTHLAAGSANPACGPAS